MHPPPPPPQAESAQRRASSTCSTAPRRSTSIGCMAGLLRLFSPYHRSHHRKRLTAKNATQQASPAPPPPLSPPPKIKKAETVVPHSPLPPSPPSPVKPAQQQQQPAVFRRRRSCDAPRSPTIAPEHRRASCDSPRPAIVARLMGLEESTPPSPRPLPTRPPPPPPTPAPHPETAAEKRRKLLGALEKCDEDLKTLRRIIAAVRAAEMRAAAASSEAVPTAGSTPQGNKGANWKTAGRDEQLTPSPSPSPQRQHYKPRVEEVLLYPSPDSVLDAISSPRFPCSRKRPSPCTDHDAGTKAGCGNGAVVPTVGSKIVKPSRTFVFSGEYCKIKAGVDDPPLHAAVGAHRHPSPPVAAIEAFTVPARRLPRAAGAESWRHHHRRRWELEAAAAGRVIGRAMADSVADTWGHGAGEQRLEAGRVAAALERAIVQDLVADTVADLLAHAPSSGHGQEDHGAGCRKRLCF